MTAKRKQKPRLTRFGVEGFKRLRKLDLEMRPLMVLIGANGVGKTAFLEAIAILLSEERPVLYDLIKRLGGIDNVLARGGADSLSFQAVLLKADNREIELSLQIDPRGIGGSPKKQKYILRNGNVTASFETPKVIRTLLPRALYSIPDASDYRSPLRLPQQLRPTDELLSPDGGDLISQLYNLMESKKNRYDVIVDTIHAAFPGFESFSFPPVAAGMISLKWVEKGFSKPFYMNELSSGTLKFLWLVTLLQLPNLPSILMIDEPEGSLHPEMLSLLADLFREASQRTQLIVATQSASLIRFMKPEEVVVMDLDEEGFATAHWGDEFELDEWMQDYTLDELWHMGRLAKDYL